MSDVNNRATLHKKLIVYLNTVNNHAKKPISLSQMKEFYAQAEKIYDNIEVIQAKLIGTAASDDALATQQSEGEKIEGTYISLRSQLREMIDAAQKPPAPIVTTAPPPPPTSSLPATLRLPQVDLPPFDGNLAEWTSFSDMFQAGVGKQSALGDSLKLHYLKSSLRGEALGVVKSLAITDGNYSVAWKLLEDRYNNHREIVSTLINRLLDIKPIKNESAAELQLLLDSVGEILRQLELLKCPVDQWNDLLVIIVLRKLDATTRREWAIRLTGTDLSKYDDLIKFLQAHVRGLQATVQGGSSRMERNPDRKLKSHHTTKRSSKCLICTEDHPHYLCPSLKNGNVSDRVKVAQRHRLCFNCLEQGHSLRECQSKGTCKKCGKRHHTILHGDRAPRDSSSSSSSSAQGAPTQSSSSGAAAAGHYDSSTVADQPAKKSYHVKSEGGAVFMTAVVNVPDARGTLQQCRVFFDTGSEAELIEESTVQRLGLRREHTNVRITGVSESDGGKTRGTVRATLISRFNSANRINAKLHVLQPLTGLLPSAKCQGQDWEHLRGIEFGDPRWFSPGHVDIIIGIKKFHQVIQAGRRISGDPDAPVAWESIFGWLVSGSCPLSGGKVRSYHITADPVMDVVKRFWELEDIPVERQLSKEEEECQQHFQRTHQRMTDGRYILQVPFNSKVKSLGYSRDAAVKRFHQVERRMKRNPEFSKQYINFMQEYIALGHMVKISTKELTEVMGKTYYLPHHGVLNESSTTTKLRVVFDGSATTSSGISINEAMLVGPTVQSELYNILLGFRTYPIVLKADIAKMFRQFQLQKEDTDFHRIVWRESSQDGLQDYRLTTVTYGTACAPYLATRGLQQLAFDSEKEHPEAAEVLKTKAYVDDILCGESTAERAVKLYQELRVATASAGMDLRKWATNSQEVLAVIPEDLRETGPLEFDDDNSSVKALGIQWHPSCDMFKFKKIQFKFEEQLTKRKLLSDAARVFDPLGLISCVTIRAKMLLQELWKLQIGWDETVPDYVFAQWKEYREDLLLLPQLSIPRRVIEGGADLELHGFSDSSERGLGAVVYLRNIMEDGTIRVHLVTSKSKVTPLKQVSLSRLELEAAVMLAKLKSKVCSALKLECPVFLWTDSTITLKWIQGEPRKWSTFIGNRVAKIQNMTEVENWMHVPGLKNPSDLISRGVPAEELLENDFWWKGPLFLSEPGLPYFKAAEVVVGDMEERKTVKVNHVTTTTGNLINNYSSLNRLKRATAYLLRFVGFIRMKLQIKQTFQQQLSATELQQAIHYLVRDAQREHFIEDINSPEKHGHVSSKSNLKSLHPYLDKEGLLRVTGRISKADIPESGRHQLILPQKSNLTTLIIRNAHLILLHGGFQVTYGKLQSEYWIIGGRTRVRNLIRRCVLCQRFRAQTAVQLMGDLPLSRITPSRAFLHTGVDYAGPYILRNPVGRVPKTYKGYLSIFVCLSTEAVHLELVSSLTTEAFLQALRRFVSRRGLCAHLHSDNGTNFVGADNELQAPLQQQQQQDTIEKDVGEREINWHFIPPSAPHQGGIWEAAVKSAKFHLKRVLGGALMTYEQMSTVFCQVEAVMNSRPLYALSAEPGDFSTLTPGHFIIGEPLTAVPDAPLGNIPSNRLKQFQQQQQRVQHFWKRWSAEYLNTLQQRNKWMWQKDNVKVGDLVLIVEDSSPGVWKRGRIEEVIKGDDGLVRVVVLRMVSGLV